VGWEGTVVVTGCEAVPGAGALVWWLWVGVSWCCRRLCALFWAVDGVGASSVVGVVVYLMPIATLVCMGSPWGMAV
jgi:hypothetical protein